MHDIVHGRCHIYGIPLHDLHCHMPAYIYWMVHVTYVIRSINMPKGHTCTVIGRVTQMTTVRSQTAHGPRVCQVPVQRTLQSSPKYKKAKETPLEPSQMSDDPLREHLCFTEDMDDPPASKVTCIGLLSFYNAYMTNRHHKTILKSGC